MRTLASLFVLLVLSSRSLVPGAEPVISEFMADNAHTLADENGQFPDWVEIHNPSGASLDLAGYFLTDDSQQLAKWAFPSVTLPGGGFLVVFASGQDRTNDPVHLHTSFQLNADGGFLALVRPDGKNIASAYTYPKVKEDVAFGIAQSVIRTSLLTGSTPRVLVPTNAADLPADWNQPAFSPGPNWLTGVAPPAVGFDTNLFIGAPVNVALSGTAVQSTVNGSFTPNLGIDGNFGNFTHTLGTDTSPFWQVTLTNEMAIFSVILFNRTSCCGSRLRDITIEILATNAMGTVTNYTSALLNPENTGFVYPNGPAFLSNNLVSITGGPVSGRIVRVRRAADPDLSGTGGQGNTDEPAVLSLGEVVINASAAAGLRPYFTTDLQSIMFTVNPSVFVRAPFTAYPATTTNLALNVRYDDGFVAYLNGVEIARRNAPAAPAWDATATVDRNFASAATLETIDLTASLPLLAAGANVLAVQVLNAASANGDALFQAELIASGPLITTNVFFDDPTPGTFNTTGWYYDEVGDTHFSVDRGFFDAPFSLSITSATPDAVIYYSFNGDEPGPGKGILYSNAFTITNTTVVRTRAFKTDWKPTDVDSATYLFLN
ncbi:MAG TPA: lamin tail domain-containing protein, partial [Verrucomicrobiae bacterium]